MEAGGSSHEIEWKSKLKTRIYESIGLWSFLQLSQEVDSTTITYVYYAWNRLVRVEYGASVRSEYSYNGLNWRVLKRADTFPHDGDLDQQRVMYYNHNWQLVEEFIDGSRDRGIGPRSCCSPASCPFSMPRGACADPSLPS